MDKSQSLNLKDADHAMAWISAFKAKCRADKKTDVLGSEDPLVARDLAQTDQFLFRCGTECLVKLKSLVAPKELEEMPFNDIETVLKTYLEPQQRLVMAEQTTFVSLSQMQQETKSDFLARLRETAKHCQFDKLKTATDTSEYMVRLRFIAGLADSDEKMKAIEELNVPDGEKKTSDDILKFLQRREQALKFVKPPQPDVEGINFGKEKKFPSKRSDVASKEFKCKRCDRVHKPKRCPAFGKICNSCKKKGHFAACCPDVSRNNFVGPKTDVEGEETDDNVYFGRFTRTGGEDLETVNIMNQDVKTMKDTGAAITIISEHMWKMLGSPKLMTSKKVIEAYDACQFSEQSMRS